MAKVVAVSFSNWIYEQYLQNNNSLNRSKYIEEMFVKGINSELGEFQGVHAKAIEAIKEVRARDELIANLKRELTTVKSKVITQDKRRAEKEAKEKSTEKRRELERIADGLRANNPLAELEDD